MPNVNFSSEYSKSICTGNCLILHVCKFSLPLIKACIYISIKNSTLKDAAIIQFDLSYECNLCQDFLLSKSQLVADGSGHLSEDVKLTIPRKLL